MTPLFSIIIPVYKVEAYLRKCLDSILAAAKALEKVGSTFAEATVDMGESRWTADGSNLVEVICVDDGSPDGCPAILDEYVEKVENLGGGGQRRFKVIHQPNRGVSAARNVALDVATGEWIQFLDSDDSIAEDFLVKLKEAIDANPGVDAVEHTAIYCYADGRRVYGDNGRLPPTGIVDAQEILSDPFGKRLTNLGRCSCYKIFRREVIEKNQLRFTPGIPVAEDSLFAAQFYAYAGKVAICPDVAGYLRIFREGSALMTIKSEKLIPQIHAAEVLYDVWLRHPSRGLATNISATLVVLATLGKGYGGSVWTHCREAVLSSSFWSGKGLRFIIMHGSWKMRIFAAIMLASPKSIKRVIVNRL